MSNVLSNNLLEMAETCSKLELFSKNKEIISIEKDKWFKFKELCRNLKDSTEILLERYQTNSDFQKLSKQVTDIDSFTNNENFVVSPKPKNRISPPLQRARTTGITFKKRRSEEFESCSNSDDDDNKKGKGRRQRAKAAPSEELYCRSCGETQTCEWRRGPDGYKSLCNACGIHYAKIVKKEETALHSYKPKNLKLDMLLNSNETSQTFDQIPSC